MHTEAKPISSSRVLRQRAVRTTLAVVSVIIVSKFVAYVLTGSVSLLSSLFDSIFDLMGSLLTAYGVKSALRPPDRDHRFGHGKAEPLASLVQAVIILGSSFFLAYESITRLFRPQKIEADYIGIAVMLFAIALTVALVVFQRKVVNKTKSAAIAADSMHYIGDAAVDLAVIVALVLNRLTGFIGLDPVFALGITGWLFFTAYKILKLSIGALMDEELPQAEREKIREIVLRHADAHDLHDMRTRTDGERVFIEIHVEMNGEMKLSDAHALAEKITADIVKEFPTADVLVHQDPIGAEEYRLDSQIEKAAQEQQS